MALAVQMESLYRIQLFLGVDLLVHIADSLALVFAELTVPTANLVLFSVELPQRRELVFKAVVFHISKLGFDGVQLFLRSGKFLIELLLQFFGIRFPAAAFSATAATSRAGSTPPSPTKLSASRVICC